MTDNQNEREGQSGGIEIERDNYGRSDAQADQQAGGAMSGGRQLGGGPSQSDFEPSGGSSGTGGYGHDANTVNNEPGRMSQSSQSGYGSGRERGERFDDEQGGGRGPIAGLDDGPGGDMRAGGSSGGFDRLEEAVNEWDRQQGVAGQQGGQTDTDFDQEQGSESEFERDQQEHQRRGQDSIESDQ